MSLEVFLETRPRRLTDWLERNYPNKGTRATFRCALKTWIKCFYGKNSVTDYIGFRIKLDKETVKRNLEERINEIEEGIDKYLSELDERNFIDDFKKFINWVQNEGYANSYVHTLSSKVKTFFARQDPRCKIDDEIWADIKRTLLPKSRRTATQDDILTKEQLKTVIKHLSIHGKALALFLLSASARVGAAVQLKMEDINLDLDPPEVNIRNEYTKGKVGGRVMWFSYEAGDAIREWHKVRPFRKKGGGFGSYDTDLVFNFTEVMFTRVWNRALRRADGARALDPSLHILCKRDPSTKLRVHVYHVHTLRKFFRTNMGLAGVPDMIVHGWMGHKAYLEEAYARGRRAMAELYKENMDAVTVYEVGTDEKARAEIKELIEVSEKRAKQITVDEAYIDMVGEQLDAFAGLSKEAKEALSVKEKWNLIINKVSQLKAELAIAREQSLEELEKALKQVSTTKNAGRRVKAT